MNKLPMAPSFEHPDLCASCGGSCCRQMPGAAMPEDFGDSLETIETSLREALSSGRWAIDWWEGDPREGDPRDGSERLLGAYFARPAVRGSDGLFDTTVGTCTFLGDHGCTIFDARPSGCRGLKPSRSFPQDCAVQHSSKRDAAIAWIPYMELLFRVAQEIERDSWHPDELD